MTGQMPTTPKALRFDVFALSEDMEGFEESSAEADAEPELPEDGFALAGLSALIEGELSEEALLTLAA
jgi:hypothetical protein